MAAAGERGRVMTVSLLLDMAVSGDPERTALVCDEVRWSTGELQTLAHGGAGVVAASGARSVAYVGTGGHMLPLLIFAAASASVPVTPLNYRLSGAALGELVARLDDPLLVCDDEYHDVVSGFGQRVMRSGDFVAAAPAAAPVSESPPPDGGESVAVGADARAGAL